MREPAVLETAANPDVTPVNDETLLTSRENPRLVAIPAPLPQEMEGVAQRDVETK
jgi:hypothetical protein